MANGTSTFRLDGGAGRGTTRPRPPAHEHRPSPWRSWAAALFWFVAVVILLAPYSSLHPYQTRVGEPARADVKAPFRIEVVDREETAKALEKIRQNPPGIWVRDEGAESRAAQRLNIFINLLRKENPRNPRDLDHFILKLHEQLDLALDETTVNQFQENRLGSLRPPLSLSEVGQGLTQIIANVLNGHNLVSDVVTYQAFQGKATLKLINSRGTPLSSPEVSQTTALWWPGEVKDYVLNVELPRYFPGPEYAGLRQAAAELLMKLLGPNVVFDSQRSAEQFEQANQEQLSHPLRRVYQSEDKIVRKGQPLTQVQADALGRLNEISRNSMAIKLAGIALAAAVFFIAVAFYLKRFRHEVALTAQMVTLYVLPPLMALCIGQAMALRGLDKAWIMIWFPSAMVGMLSSLLLAPQVAFLLILVAACLFGIVTEQDLSFLIYALFGGFSAVFASRSVRARGEVLMVGFLVGLVNIITLAILSLLKAMQMPDPVSLFAAFLNGLACSLGTLIFLVIFERAFGIVTDLRLLELTGLRNPLTIEFEEKAPGSYQHVLNVTKLAEAAALAIGANYLLVRAGAFFHDIGKMVKPKYYSENQVTLEDKRAHSRLSPYMSVLIIKNHVKEGIDLARRYGLPQKIVDFIPQHHGTGLIRYFYSEACKRYAESGAVDEPREEDFRYPGPRPQSIETAIVLLADGVEAIAASKFTGGQVSEGELRRMVQTAITERFDDGQFDECDLTLRHLHRIREAFVKTLLARYHFRVTYPTMPKRELPREGTREPLPAPISVAGPAA